MLSDWEHVDGSVYFGRLTYSAESRAECERVDDCGKHAHLVAFHTVKTFGCSLETTEYVASADYNRHLHSGGHDFAYLLCIGVQTLGINAVTFASGEDSPLSFKSMRLYFVLIAIYL